MARTLVYSDGFDYSLASMLSSAASWELNRSDGTNDNDFEVRDSDIRAKTQSTRSVAQVTGETYSADQYAKITFSTGPLTGINGGLALRCQSPSTSENCYRLTIDNFTTGTPDTFDIQIAKYDAGVSSTLSTVHTMTAPSIPFTLSFEAEGTSLRGYVNDVEVTEIAVTDSTFSAGVPGIQVFFQDNAARWDTFESGDVASAITGTGSHTAATATHSASGTVGTLQTVLNLVDRNNNAAPDDSGITAVVYDEVSGVEVYSSATQQISSGTMTINYPSGTTVNNGDEVFVTLHKAGASFTDDFNGAGRATVTQV